MKKAIVEKGIYKLKKFDRTCVLGTHLGNQLKKFVRRKGFYKPAKEEEDKDEDKEREKEAIKFANVVG